MGLVNYRIENFAAACLVLLTLLYGVVFIIMTQTEAYGLSSLYSVMLDVHPRGPLVWGIAAIAAAVLALARQARLASMLGFMVWLFAGICYIIMGNYLLFICLTVPLMLFWLLEYAGML